MVETSRESKQRRREVSVSVEICGGSFFSFLSCAFGWLFVNMLSIVVVLISHVCKIIAWPNATSLLYTAPLFIYYFTIFIFGLIIQLSSYFISSPALEFFF